MSLLVELELEELRLLQGRKQHAVWLPHAQVVLQEDQVWMPWSL